MTRSTDARAGLLIGSMALIMTFLFAGAAAAADGIALPAMTPATLFYTTSGAEATDPVNATANAPAPEEPEPVAEANPLTDAMKTAAQRPALTEEEVTAIVYRDLNTSLGSDGPGRQKIPKLSMRKYSRSEEPYVIWEVTCRFIYVINAITGQILSKQFNENY